MNDTEVLDWIEKNPGMVKPGFDTYNRPRWYWSANAKDFYPAFTLRSAVHAAKEANRFGESFRITLLTGDSISSVTAYIESNT